MVGIGVLISPAIATMTFDFISVAKKLSSSLRRTIISRVLLKFFQKDRGWIENGKRFSPRQSTALIVEENAFT